MSNLFRAWLLIAYAITVPLIIFFASMSILSALIMWVFYIPACVLGLLLVDRFYTSAGLPLLFRQLAHACMAVMLFLYPTWDAFVGKYYLKKICIEYGGVYVTPGLKIDSLYVDLPISEKSIGDLSSPEDLQKLKNRVDNTFYRMQKNIGFSMLERPVKDSNSYIQIYSTGDMGMHIEISNNSKSQFEESYGAINPYRKIGDNLFARLKMKGNSVYYKDRKTGDKVAWFDDYYFTQRFDSFWRAIGGSGSASCKSVFSDNEKFKPESLSKMILENNQKQ